MDPLRRFLHLESPAAAALAVPALLLCVPALAVVLCWLPPHPLWWGLLWGVLWGWLLMWGLLGAAQTAGASADVGVARSC